MNKKGFTLIELLAVILILGIIALIAIPTVTNIIEDAKKKAAETSAKMYIDAVEQYLAISEITSNYVKLQPNQTYQVSSDTVSFAFFDLFIDKVYADDAIYLNSLVNVKGTKPKYGEVTIGSDNDVSYAKLVIDNYKIEYGSSDGITSVVKGHIGTTHMRFSHISSGGNHTLAIDTSGNLWAWGDNSSGQLGDGTTTSSLTPIKIMGSTQFTEISAGSDGGGNSHSAAIDSEGNLWTWGYNGYGELGDNSTTTRTSPVKVKEGTSFKKVSSGTYHTLAIDREGYLWTFGANFKGQIGNDSTISTSIPVKIRDDKKFVDISAGESFSMAIDEAGNLWAWGYNGVGSLGDGTVIDKKIPTIIKEGTIFSSVSSGKEHTAALTATGILYVWGNNSGGQIGDETTTDRKKPTAIGTDLKFKEVSANNYQSLALDADGTLYAWGANGSGIYGNGTTTKSTKPLAIKIGQTTAFIAD